MSTAHLVVGDAKFDLPLVESTEGPDGILVSSLRNDGWVTLDPGFLTTAQCESAITFIDGRRSILRYRGYPIEELRGFELPGGGLAPDSWGPARQEAV